METTSALSRGCRFDWTWGDYAGICDESIDSAEALVGLLESCRHFSLLADVGTDRPRLASKIQDGIDLPRPVMDFCR